MGADNIIKVALPPFVMAPSPRVSRELHFVTVSSAASRSTPDEKERRSLRAFVMRDYLRQKNDPHWKFAPANVAGRMDSHISRFRSTRPTTTTIKPRKRTKKAPKGRESTTSVRRPRPLVPAPVAPGKSLGPLNKPSKQSHLHDLDVLDPFQTFKVDLSHSDDLILLQYYHTSFWANSYACNPEGRWLSVALMDPAIIHATLSLVAIHRRDCFSIDLSKAYFKHRGEAMKIIASRLNDAKESMSDATIGAVSILSSSDNHFEWPSEVQGTHSLGLAELIALRGGIDSLSSNRHIQRVAGWADLLQSAMHGTSLRVKMPSSVAKSSESPRKDVQDLTPGISLRELPQSITDILRQLQTLSSLKRMLISDRNAELCRTFSDLLWQLEYSILGDTGVVAETLWSSQIPLSTHSLTANVVGMAALMFSYSNLRNLAAPILFDKLSGRLRDYLSPGRGPSQSSLKQAEAGDSHYPAPHLGECLEGDELAVLLWVLYHGAQGSRSNRSNKEWFMAQIAQVCWNSAILSHAAMREALLSVIPQAQPSMEVSEEFWEEVEELMVTEMLSM